MFLSLWQYKYASDARMCINVLVDANDIIWIINHPMLSGRNNNLISLTANLIFYFVPVRKRLITKLFANINDEAHAKKRVFIHTLYGYSQSSWIMKQRFANFYLVRFKLRIHLIENTRGIQLRDKKGLPVPWRLRRYLSWQLLD